VSENNQSEISSYGEPTKELYGNVRVVISLSRT
jgi:hypothetical protein